MTDTGTQRTIVTARPPQRREPARRIGLWLAAGFALTVVFATGWTIYALSAPQGAFATMAPLSPVHEARAVQALSGARGPAGLDQAEAETRAALAASPALASAWVRLAYIDAVRHGALTATGRQALERSYEISPLGPDVSQSRLRIVFGLWPTMPEAIRDQAFVELTALRRRDWHGAHALVREIRDPAGRLAAGMQLASLDARPVRQSAD